MLRTTACAARMLSADCAVTCAARVTVAGAWTSRSWAESSGATFWRSRGRAAWSTPSTANGGAPISTDTNGDFGCWFIDVEELVQTFGAEAVNEKLEEYEAAQAAARKQAVADAAARLAAHLAEDDVGGEEG